MHGSNCISKLELNLNLHIIDMHVHSNCSDGLNSPMELAKYAKRKGLSGFAIVDHAPKVNAGSIIRRRFKLYENAFRRSGLLVLPGFEFSFSDGHLLAIFPDFNCDFSFESLDDIDSLYDVVESFNGILIAAHVFRDTGLGVKINDYADYLDAIEIYPFSRKDFIKSFSLPLLAGSDSHTFLTLGFAATVFYDSPSSIDDALDLIRDGRVSPMFFRPYSLRRLLDFLRWLHPSYLSRIFISSGYTCLLP